MSLPGAQIPSVVRTHFRKTLNVGYLARSLSSSSVICASEARLDPTEDMSARDEFDKLLIVQTHTGIRNMAHGLHILRNIEKSYGPVESYLFPREQGSGDHLPSFFFKFRDIQSFLKLSKPYTHLDVPSFSLTSKPNYLIGLADLQGLISSASSDGGQDVDPGDKARFAVRIEISGKPDYPQPRLSYEASYAQKSAVLQRTLATWKGAASLVGSSNTNEANRSNDWPRELDHYLNDHFDIPEASKALSRRRQHNSLRQELGSRAEQIRPDPGFGNLPPLKMRPRSAPRQATNKPLPTEGDIRTAKPSTSAIDPEEPQASHEVPPLRSAFSKRERMLEQTRRAAAAEAKSLADQKAAAEEAAKQAEIESQTPQNPPPSVWSRFLGR